jgi:hypothetical protein
MNFKEIESIIIFGNILGTHEIFLCYLVVFVFGGSIVLVLLFFKLYGRLCVGSALCWVSTSWLFGF